MKVLYLLNRVQRSRIEGIKQRKDNDNHLYGMLRLPSHGVETSYVEIEQYLPSWLANFIRNRVLNIYWVHLPLFFKFFTYDAVFTSTAFGSQFFHTLCFFKKPKWIMLDFSLSGLLGEEKTLKQKVLAFMVERADGIVTIDAHEKRALEERFPSLRGNIKFIRFAVDTEFFNPRPGHEEENTIFSPGRDPGRDFRTLFQAIRDLDVRVVLTARPGSIKKMLPLPASVTNADLAMDEYIMMFAKASIVVIPLDTKSGINNAMGTSTLVEAMAMGKAVIATRTKTTESYIEHGRTGLLVSPQDPGDLRKAIVTLLGDQYLRARLGAEARGFVVELCSAEGFASELAIYLKSVIK